MKAQDIAIKITREHARCNHNHSGTRMLTYDLGHYECDGCGAIFTAAQIDAAKINPSQFTRAGGVIWLPKK